MTLFNSQITIALILFSTFPVALAASEKQTHSQDHHIHNHENHQAHDADKNIKNQSDKRISTQGGELITVSASGLVCDFCAQAIEKVFLKEPAVSMIDVNLAQKTILIGLHKGATLTDEFIHQKIVSAGYNLIHMERKILSFESNGKTLYNTNHQEKINE